MTTTTADQQPDAAAQTALSAAEQPDTAQQPTEAENGAQNGADEPEQADERDERPVGREAAKYRRRLRDTEQALADMTAERDRLRAAVLEAAVTAGVDVQHDQYPASTRRLQLRDPADLERFGVDTTGLWGDDGLDRDALGQALAELHRQRPELFARPEPIPGISATPLTPARRPGGSWEAAFQPGRRR